MKRFNRRTGAGLLPALLVFIVVFAGLLVAILAGNGGVFTYSLDDPYIHLALAANIARGHYGVNPGEFSAPASSILWPFILAPVAGFPWGSLFPLLLNFLATLGVIGVFHQFVSRFLEGLEEKKRGFLHTVLLIFLIPVTQLPGLAFTGMEHSMQLLLTGLLFLGMVRLGEDGQPAWWFCAAVVLGPLIRYENLALSLPAVAMIAVWGFRRRALATTLAFALPIILFSAFLASHGLGVLPTSVKAKVLNPPPLSSQGARGTPVSNLLENLTDRQGTVIALFSAVFLFLALRRREDSTQDHERWVAGAAAFGGGALLLVGKIGWFSRYEIFLWGNYPVLLLWLLRRPLVAFIAREPLFKPLVAGFALFLPAALPYVMTQFAVPAAAHNIYGHQYQMHRFIRDFYRAPVAVNDLGLAVYGNHAYILDLLGLASKAALDARHPGVSGEWMKILARERNVKLAMVFPRVFAELPADWKLVGKLVFNGPCVISADPEIHFYALDEAEATRIDGLLASFAATLPPCSRFERTGTAGSSR